MVADPQKTISRSFGLRGFFGPGRVTWVMDRRRVITAVYKNLFNVAGHVDQSLAALQALVDRDGPVTS